MKLNLLNDESNKFDIESDQNFFESQSSAENNVFDDISFEEPSPEVESKPETILDDEFSDIKPKKSKTTFPKEHEIISDESRTHRKLRLSILALLLFFTAIYYSLDYVDLDKLIASTNKEESPTEYIEIITPNSAKTDSIKTVPPIKNEKKETNPIIRKAVPTKTRNTISSSIIQKSSNRLNQINAIQKITSYSFVSAKLEQIYLLNKIIYFEVFSTTRSKLGAFSKALNNQKPSIKLTKSRNHQTSGSSGTFMLPVSQTNTSDFGELQSNSEVITLVKQFARSNNISILETTKENSSSVLIRANGSLKSMSKFLKILNTSLNNVALSKLNLVSTKQKKTSNFLLSMRLNVLN